MLKKIYWFVFILIVFASAGVMVYYGLQPRAVSKINISQFEDSGVLARSLLLRFRDEIHASPLLLFGMDPNNQDDWQVLKVFLQENQEAGFRYDHVVVDQYLNPPTDFPSFEKIETKESFETLWQGLNQALQAQQRVIVIMPYVYSAQMVQANVANQLRQKISDYNQQNPDAKWPEPTSFSLAKLTRSRPEEKQMQYPCIVEGVDQTGAGPFGCQVAQVARSAYRKHFPSGSHIGLASQIGLHDYLILHTIEK